MAIKKTSLQSLWWREKGVSETDGYTILDPRYTGMGDYSVTNVGDTTPVYGRDALGRFVEILAQSTPPGDFDSFSINVFEEIELLNPLVEKLLVEKKGFKLQRLTFACPPVNNRALWKQLEYYNVNLTPGTRGAGPMQDGSDTPVNTVLNVKVIEKVPVIFKTSLSNLTQTANANDLFCITGLKYDIDCLAGYPGKDKILVVGCEAGAGVVAQLIYSVTGGSSWAAIGTDPSPLTTIDVDLVGVASSISSETQFRLWVLGGADPLAGVKTQFAYQDFNFSGSLTAASWNVVTIAATTAGDAGEAIYFYENEARLYIAAAGDIYISTDRGETDPGTADYTGAQAIAQFCEDDSGNIWACGATGTILRELASNRGTFAARTAPGSSAVSAITVADDGTVFIGYGTTLQKSTDNAGSTGGWTSLKDFGASHAVKAIQCKNGTSECLRVVVDDTTPGNGEIWESEDLGLTWRQVTEVTNGGYNAAYFPDNWNKAIIVGDDDGANGEIHLLSV